MKDENTAVNDPQIKIAMQKLSKDPDLVAEALIEGMEIPELNLRRFEIKYQQNIVEQIKAQFANNTLKMIGQLAIDCKDQQIGILLGEQIRQYLKKVAMK